jgi:hypothetical protein
MWSEDSELEKPRWVSTSVEEEKEKESRKKGKGKEKENESVQSAGLNSEALTTTSRAVFQLLENERREKEKGAVVDKWDMCRINGAVDYDGDGVMSWVFECVVFLLPFRLFKPHWFRLYRVGPLARLISATSKNRNIVAPSSFQRCGQTVDIGTART